MAQGTKKVWVINPSDAAKRQKPAARTKKLPRTISPPRAPAAGPPSRPVKRERNAGGRWRPVLLAYLLGPIALALWLEKRRRVAWAVVGFGSSIAGATLLAFRSSFNSWLEAGTNGALLWLAIVPTLILAVVTAWARAIAAANCDRPIPTTQLPRRVRDPRVVTILGMIVPGLGLLISGHPRRAAWAFGIAGPMAAAAVILAHWRWLWERGQSAIPSGIPGGALEVVFVAAAGVAVIALLAWIVQALDGARLVSSHRSYAFADATSVALLISLVLLVATFRPASFAWNLHAAAATLQLDEFRLIPLGLCEAAARLDPVNPVYLAHAAELYEAMGMKNSALAKREVIKRRAKEYIEMARGDGGAVKSTLAFPSVVLHPLDMKDRLTANNAHTWSRIRALYR